MVFDIFVSLFVNSKLVSYQKDYLGLEKELTARREKTARLEAEVFSLGSLVKVKEEADKLALVKSEGKTVFIKQEQLAAK